MIDENSVLSDTLLSRRDRDLRTLLERDSRIAGRLDITQQEIDQARERRSKSVYELVSSFLEGEVEEDVVFCPEELNDMLRPPYQTETIRDALEYGEAVDDRLNSVDGEDGYVYQFES